MSECKEHNWQSKANPACPYCIIKDLNAHAVLTGITFQHFVDLAQERCRRITLLKKEMQSAIDAITVSGDVEAGLKILREAMKDD